MNRQDKVVIAGVSILAVILLFWLLRRGGVFGNTLVNNSSPDLPTLTGPANGDYYPGSGSHVPIVIPGLNLGGPNLSMIGACCSDCMSNNSFGDNFGGDGSRNTYVFNAGNVNGATYNYSTGGGGSSLPTCLEYGDWYIDGTFHWQRHCIKWSS